MSQAEDIIEIKELIKGLDDCIRGNGRVGVLTRLSNMELKFSLIAWVLIVEAGVASTLIGKLLYDYFVQ